MVIHSSPGSRRRKKVLPEKEVKKLVAPEVPEKKVVIEESVKVEEPMAIVIDDPTAEEFIATLPKKQSRKKVTKIIEE